MITINYEGKTYKTKETDWVIPNAIDSWIEMGALEEVKENKEPQFTPGQEIELLPEFDYKEVCGKYAGKKYPEAKALIEYGEHIELLTKAFNQLINK